MPYLESTGATHSILGTVTQVFWLLQGQQLPSASTYFLSPLSTLGISQVSCSYLLRLPFATSYHYSLPPLLGPNDYVWLVSLGLGTSGHTRQRCSCILCHPLHYSVPCMTCQLVSMIFAVPAPFLSWVSAAWGITKHMIIRGHLSDVLMDFCCCCYILDSSSTLTSRWPGFGVKPSIHGKGFSFFNISGFYLLPWLIIPAGYLAGHRCWLPGDCSSHSADSSGFALLFGEGSFSSGLFIVQFTSWIPM